MSKVKTIYCCECEKDVKAKMVSGKTVYPHREDLYSLKFYQCQNCMNKVGVHKSTNNPLGVIPSKEISSFRVSIHNIIDPLWKKGYFKRQTIYKVMSIQFGKKFHTAHLRNISECEWALHHATILNNIAMDYGKDASNKLQQFGWYVNKKQIK